MDSRQANLSHPSRGAWIETQNGRHQPESHQRRTPHGVRGLKRSFQFLSEFTIVSHPSRGAWIETLSGSCHHPREGGRTPHGVRGLKRYFRYAEHMGKGRTPHGVRGLKPQRDLGICQPYRQSHPSRGAWIEINPPKKRSNNHGSRTPHGVRGLK